MDYAHGQTVPLLCHKEDGFIVNDTAGNDILQQSDLLNRKVVVISIVGEYRRGKSFFLNFVMRYLANQGKPGWMNDKGEALKGFSWRRGMIRETDGIVMWSRAFPLGDEYAVILLDTEGTYDEQSTNKTMSHVFSCSALISSVQIFNVHEKITKQTMHEIQAFAEFGRLASCPEAKQAFQKLIYLVRDWSFDDFDYGFDGGSQYLNHWLKNDKDGVQDTLNNCFSDVRCYLMPYPGDKVKKDKNFNGKTSDMNEEFNSNIKQLIETLFSPEYIQSKEIGGTPLKLKDFMTYFSMFANTLNKSGVEPKSLFQAQVESSNMRAREEAVKYYREKLEQLTEGEDPIDGLDQINTVLVSETLGLFDGQPKVGGSEHAQTYRDSLIHEVGIIFTKADNANTYKKMLKSKIDEKEKQLWEAENARIQQELEHKHAMENAMMEQAALKDKLETSKFRQNEELMLLLHKMQQEAATDRMKMQLQFQEQIEELKRNRQNEEMERLKEAHKKQLRELEERVNKQMEEEKAKKSKPWWKFW